MQTELNREWLKQLTRQEDIKEGENAFLNRPSIRASIEKEAQDLIDKVCSYDTNR